LKVQIISVTEHLPGQLIDHQELQGIGGCGAGHLLAALKITVCIELKNQQGAGHDLGRGLA
jgi:hypothetical protein